MSSAEDDPRAVQNDRVLDQFGRQAGAYAALIERLGRRSAGLQVFLEIARPGPQDRVLDVGCGSGQLAVGLAPLVAHVTGLDLTPEMLDQARAAQTAAGLDNLDWRQGDAAALPFTEGEFSLVISQAAFHHAADPAAVLAEMTRVCAPGGRIAVSDLTPPPEKSAAFDAIEILRDPSHAHALPLEELRGLGARLGLAEIGVSSHATAAPVAPVLAASCPPPEVAGRLHELYARDAAAGADALGMGAHFRDGEVWAAYPMSLVVWRRQPPTA